MIRCGGATGDASAAHFEALRGVDSTGSGAAVVGGTAEEERGSGVLSTPSGREPRGDFRG